MQLRCFTSLVCAAIAAVNAHSTDDSMLEDYDVSLPDLEKLEILDAPKWSINGDARFEEGRLILTSGVNTQSHISNDFEISYDTFTIESVFRSMGSYGKTGSGFSLNLIKKHNTKDTSFFGSEGTFDGLKVIVDSDSKEGSSVHAFLNDGTINFGGLEGDALYDKAFGSCTLPYQESQVPTTLRIASYDGSLLIQVNNEVCLKTSKIQLPGSYKVGVSASASSTSKEVFELFRLKTYSGILSEVTENEGKAAPRAELVTEYVRVDDNNEPIGKIDIPAQPASAPLSDYLGSVDEIHKSNKALFDLVQSLEAKIAGLSAIAASSGKGKQQVDFSYLEEHSKQINKLTTSVTALEEKISKLDLKLISLERNIKIQMDTHAQLNSRLASQLQNNDRQLVDLAKSVEFLVQAEKENQVNTAIHDLVASLKYLIFPILLISAALSFFTYRLRHEIKQKLL